MSSGTGVGPAIIDPFGVYKERLLLLIFSIVQESEEVYGVRLKLQYLKGRKAWYLDKGWWAGRRWQLTRDGLGLGRNGLGWIGVRFDYWLIGPQGVRLLFSLMTLTGTD